MRGSSKPEATLLAPSGQTVRSCRLRQRNLDQPDLPFDPMPERIEPCLALLQPKVPVGPDWLFEVKWDGYRLAVHIDRQDVRILTRGGHDWTHRFPSIAASAKKIGVHTAILDGEAVVLDPQGRSDFGALQRSLGGRGGKRTSTESVMMVFDLLYLDGHDLTGSELAVRRHLLEDLIVAGGDGAIRLSEEVEADGAGLLEHVCHAGLEGIIAKRRQQPYRSGRTGDWLKIKCIQSETFKIIGYELSAAARGGIGSLLLAGKRGNDWVYVGAVGTGFNSKEAASLRNALDRLRTHKPAVPLKGENLVFAQPALIAEIEFRGWSDDGKLRHASYKGLREVQDNAAVFDMTDRGT
ncbi:non-homologous end-joining DNA ligase [Mesorhizobium sp. CO1-1-8]|uniref:non-homologous end-joining DNA ligase n=1 Tax=Mesorhizobium sp. CO1-1-8 TaxID=2876631 RepID=UPI001CD0BF91|nr:non-homologous end-joining DNA ligase [Mesorhizobium sp. CO1-1-8]MBZ9775174.1 non-homologous end-joining DNA ligase [Mesorhizobium sp. CO1-1-8]